MHLRTPTGEKQLELRSAEGKLSTPPLLSAMLPFCFLDVYQSLVFPVLGMLWNVEFDQQENPEPNPILPLPHKKDEQPHPKKCAVYVG